ncbi:MAG TPA: hypothetical protein VJ850_12175 [Candidatus Limnocylindrales bacterium]|nr:hypothetical protein [Candidatus Limnocylindrales bacterium]
MRVLGAAAAALVVISAAACSDNGPITGIGGSLPMCDALPKTEADPALYRDTPIYVANEMPLDDVRAWAQGKPGFEAIWIDRDHRGWLTLAFSRDAAARQAELATEFPDLGVVAVQVPWTMRELDDLQERAMTEGRPLVQSAGIDVMHGVVSVLAGLDLYTQQQLDGQFRGTRICVYGRNPILAEDGPQEPSGDGWRLLADEDGVGGPFGTGIAADAVSLARLWSDIGLRTPMPSVDFQTEVVVWFGAAHGSSCPRIRFGGVTYNPGRGVLYPSISRLDYGACATDAIGHAYVVAIQRAILPPGAFEIRLESTPPWPGIVDAEVTTVDANLSVPGSTFVEGQVSHPTPGTGPVRVELGDYLIDDQPAVFRMSVACGVRWLDTFNDTTWRSGEDAVPAEWRGNVQADSTIEVVLTMRNDREGVHIEATAANHTIVYESSGKTPDSCP